MRADKFWIDCQKAMKEKRDDVSKELERKEAESEKNFWLMMNALSKRGCQ